MLSSWTITEQLPLLQDEVQLWRIDLNEVDPTRQTPQVLTPEEQDVASRRRAGQVRQQFAVGRACLRLLLGNALGIAPQHVPILTGPQGKPYTPIDGHSVSYNVAHSRNIIVIALRRGRPVGIDIEYIDPASDAMEIASRWFTPGEAAALASLPDAHARTQFFFHLWTRKEAIAKADGRGLLVALDTFEVAFKPVAQADDRLVPIRMPSEEGDKLYLLRDLSVGAQFAAALALASTDSPVTQYLFPRKIAFI